MVEHVCSKCNKKFNHKGSYNYHINKKNPCVPPQDKIQQLEKQIFDLQNQMKIILQHLLINKN